MKIVIGKSGILEGIFLGPVAAVLRSLEDVVDVSNPYRLVCKDVNLKQTLAFDIINAVPSCQVTADRQKQSLDVTLKQAVCAYTPLGTVVPLFC